MARLSVEHYRANATTTPENTRKNSRFRGIFRSRASMSLSTGPAKSNPKSPSQTNSQVPPASPTSPTVEPGFEQVGLLPSERTSSGDVKRELENHGGHHILKVLKNQEKDLKDASVPRNIDSALDRVGSGRHDHAAKDELRESCDEDVTTIADAFREKSLNHGAEANDINQTIMEESGQADGTLHTLRRTKSRQHLRKNIARDQAFLDNSAFDGPPGMTCTDNNKVRHANLESGPGLQFINQANVYRHESAANASVGELAAPGRKSVAKNKPLSKSLAADAGLEMTSPKSDNSDDGTRPRPRSAMGSTNDTFIGMKSMLNEGTDIGDQRLSARSTIVTDVCNYEDPLPQAFRDYVASKISHATVDLELNYADMLKQQELAYLELLKQQERENNEMLIRHHKTPMRVTVNIDMVGSVKAEIKGMAQRGRVFGGSASLMNSEIGNSHLAFVFQLVVVLSLLALTVAGSHSGITGPVGTTPRTWAMLRLCNAVLGRNTSDPRNNDLFLAPMAYMEVLVVNVICNTVEGH